MLRENLQKHLKEAMLNHDAQTTGAIRMIIAGMKEKDVDARGKGLEKASDADLLSMMQTMIKQRKESIKMYLDGNRQDLADKEQLEIKVIEQFLPKQMSDEEVDVAIQAIIKTIGATTMKDMGKVMGELKNKYAGQLDFGKASARIKGFLS